MDVLHVAIPVIGINQYRQRAGAHDVSRPRRLFPKPGQVDIRKTVSGSRERESTNLIRIKPGTLNQPRSKRVMRGGKLDRGSLL
jgi:hypothetical protein